MPHSSVIANTWQLYRASFLKTLPISLCCTAIYCFIRYAPRLFPQQAPTLIDISIVLGILSFPLLMALIWVINHIYNNIPYHYRELPEILFDRFLSECGVIISLLLFPALIIVLGIVGYLFIGTQKSCPPACLNLLLNGWCILVAWLVLVVSVTKLFAPVLVITDKMGANEAIETSIKYVKGYYWRILVHSTISLAGLGVILLFPALLIVYLPALFCWWRLELADLKKVFTS